MASGRPGGRLISPITGVQSLVPAEGTEPAVSAEQWLEEMEEVARDIGSMWPEGV